MILIIVYKEELVESIFRMVYYVELRIREMLSFDQYYILWSIFVFFNLYLYLE